MPTGKIIKKNLNISPPPHPHFLNCLSSECWYTLKLIFLKCLFFHIYMFTKIKNKEKT